MKKTNNIYFNITKVNCKYYTYFRIQKQVNGNKINVTGKTKKEVTEKFYAKLEELENLGKSSIDINNITFGEFVKYYLYEILEPSKSVKDSSLRQYISIYNTHINNSFLEKVKLVELRKENFQQYFNNKLKENASISLLQKLKTFISTILNYAEKEDYINKNYCKNVKLPTISKTQKHKFLTDDEIKSLLSTCKNEKLLLIIKIALSTGLRINEILALTPNDFDFKENSLKVTKTLSYSNGKINVTTPKTSTSIRVVYFNKQLTNAIKIYILIEKERYLKFGKIFDDDTFIFTTKTFTLIHFQNFIATSLNPLYKKCNIEATGFHILRHTYGSNLYSNGVDIKIISELLGHSDINTTNKIYLHLKEESKKRVVDYLYNIN